MLSKGNKGGPHASPMQCVLKINEIGQGSTLDTSRRKPPSKPNNKVEVNHAIEWAEA